MAYEKDQRNKQRRWQRRYIPRQTRIWITVAVIAVLLGGLFATAVTQGWIVLPSWEDIFPPEGSETTPATQPMEDTVIHFVAGGDVIASDKVVSAGLTGGRYDYSSILLDVTPALSGADLAALNFEGNLMGEPYGSTHFSAPQALVESLRDAGVDILQTANSKSVENGLRGLQATIRGIRDAGLQSLGTYENAAEFQKTGGYLIRDIQGVRVALVAFTKGMDGRGLPAGSEDCVNLLYTDYSSTYQKVDEAGITRVMNAVAAQKPDVVITMLHWGSELNAQISKTQTKIVKLLANLGADAIIGTHSHYVQKMGFDKDTGVFVAYSLGDFLGDGEDAGTDYSVLVDLEITKDARTGKAAITGFEAIPVYRWEDESGLRLMRIREAVKAYEDRCLGAVPEQVYLSMKDALTKVESRIEK